MLVGGEEEGYFFFSTTSSICKVEGVEFFKSLFIWLPLVLGTSCRICRCSVQTLWLWLTGLLAPRHVGYEFPDQGLTPHPLH